MDSRILNVLGLIFCLILFCTGFVINGNTGLYLNMSGLLIVLGGVFGATILSFRMERLLILIKVLNTSYSKPVKRPVEIVGLLLDLSFKKRVRGVQGLVDEEMKTTDSFFRQALGFLVDGYSPEEIRSYLHAEMFFFKKRRAQTGRVLQTMADVAPSFGIVGSVVGLIGMLAGIGDASVILATIPIALTSTLYGIILSSFVFTPFMSNIRERTLEELFLQKIIAEGIVAIAENIHPMLLERKLKSFLTPSARNLQVATMEKINLKFNPDDFL
jgi:chemotaxis protein MotA